MYEVDLMGKLLRLRLEANQKVIYKVKKVNIKIKYIKNNKVKDKVCYQSHRYVVLHLFNLKNNIFSLLKYAEYHALLFIFKV